LHGSRFQITGSIPRELRACLNCIESGADLRDFLSAFSGGVLERVSALQPEMVFGNIADKIPLGRRTLQQGPRFKESWLTIFLPASLVAPVEIREIRETAISVLKPALP
jgi:hypothetical protein